MLNNVYDSGGNYAQGKKHLSQSGINPEAPAFVPAEQANRENTDIIGAGSNAYSDQDGH